MTRAFRFVALVAIICAGLFVINPALVAGFLLFPFSLFVFIVLVIFFKRPFP